MLAVMQEAREAGPEDRWLFNFRDRAVELERAIDLVAPTPTERGAAANRAKSYKHHGVQEAYESSQFVYDAAADTYRCPEGRVLHYDAKYPRHGTIRRRYAAAAEDCRHCPAKPNCCPRTKHGRTIERREPLPAVTAFCDKMQTEEARAIYKTRAQVAEFPHLWIKVKLGMRQFRVRGLVKVTQECLWAALTYNLQHWIRLRRRGAIAATPVPA